jgi:GntR family transcriptional regulator, transcriptional repressor for pyruvate dehydrogenase complex
MEPAEPAEGSADVGRTPVPQPRDRRRAPKMAELVAADLRRRIVTRELAEGDTLPAEATLLRQLGVSRPTLREAFRVLESESLIVVHRGVNGGARVQAPRREVAATYAGLVLQHRGTTLQDLHEARVIVEPPCAGRLARHRTGDDLAVLQGALGDAASVTEPGAAVRAHLRFHELVIELAGNDTLRLLNELLQLVLYRAGASAARPGSFAHEGALRRAERDHRALVDLVEAGNAAGAQQLWREHIDATRECSTGHLADSRVIDVVRVRP